MAGFTKAQIAENKALEHAAHLAEIQELKTLLLEAKAEGEEARRRADWYEQTADDVEVVAQDVPPFARVADAALPLPSIVQDSFAPHNPFTFLKHPPGYHFGWKNPVYRESHRGWQGWRAIEFDDDIGRNLKHYLPEVPTKMAHAMDNYVRRGDSVLCVLEESAWQARQKDRSDKANRYTRMAHTDATVTVDDPSRPYVSTGQYQGRSMTS